MHIVKRYVLLVIGVLTGSIGGYLYWKLVGCTSGTCPITSNPVNSTLYGAVMGGLVLSMFQKEKQKDKS